MSCQATNKPRAAETRVAVRHVCWRAPALRVALRVIEWNNRGQPETPARCNSRVILLRKLAFFQPIAVFAALK